MIRQLLATLRRRPAGPEPAGHATDADMDAIRGTADTAAATPRAAPDFLYGPAGPGRLADDESLRPCDRLAPGELEAMLTPPRLPLPRLKPQSGW